MSQYPAAGPAPGNYPSNLAGQPVSNQWQSQQEYPQQQQYGQQYGQHQGQQGQQYGQQHEQQQYAQPQQYQQTSYPAQSQQHGQFHTTYQQPSTAPGPRSGGFLNQVNQAVSSSKPILQSFGSKLGKKFNKSPSSSNYPGYPKPSGTSTTTHGQQPHGSQQGYSGTAQQPYQDTYLPQNYEGSIQQQTYQASIPGQPGTQQAPVPSYSYGTPHPHQQYSMPSGNSQQYEIRNANAPGTDMSQPAQTPTQAIPGQHQRTEPSPNTTSEQTWAIPGQNANPLASGDAARQAPAATPGINMQATWGPTDTSGPGVPPTAQVPMAPNPPQEPQRFSGEASTLASGAQTHTPSPTPKFSATQGEDPLVQSMGNLGIAGPPGGPTPDPSHASAPQAGPSTLQVQPDAEALTRSPPKEAGQKWSLVDPQTERPTPQFRIVAGLMFEALNRKHFPRTDVIDASKILDGWKEDGLEQQWVDLFAHDSFRAFSKMWSLRQIPHILVPSNPSLVPTATSFVVPDSHLASASTTPSRIEPLSNDSTTIPSYIPALSYANYVDFLFVEFLGDPESLRRIVTNLCGDIYDVTKHPDLSLYEPSCPPELFERAKAIRTTAIESALVEAAATIAPGPAPLEATAGQGIMPMEAQLKMKQLQTMSSVNNMLNQTMMQSGQSFNASASSGIWVQKF